LCGGVCGGRLAIGVMAMLCLVAVGGGGG